MSMSAEKRIEDINRVWCQSPGGKAVAVGEAVDEHPVDRLQRVNREDPQIMELEPFLEGCLSVLPDRLEQGQIRLGVLLFLLGAADRFWSLQKLDDRRFQPYAESLLLRSGLSAPLAATLVSALPQLAGEPSARGAMVQGGEALETWLRSRDPNVALQLTELIREWRRL
jgi:hypothetical protein